MAHAPGWSCSPQPRSCRRQGDRAVVTLSIGTRPFVQITRPLMAAYADKVGAALSLVYTTGKPIVFVGVGQTYTDIRNLNVDHVVKALLR